MTDTDLILQATATIEQLQADRREALSALETAVSQMNQYRRDLAAIASGRLQLASQLTAMERKYDATLIHLRAVTAAATEMLAEVAAEDAYSGVSLRLADAIDAAIDGAP